MRRRSRETRLHIILIILIVIPPVWPPGAGREGSTSTRQTTLVPHFTNVTGEVGLAGVRGNFFSWGDYNRDGYPDLLVNGRRLFKNSGPPSFSFMDVTSHAGIDRPVNSGTWGDYDNDGYLDIYCPAGRLSSDHPTHPDILWHNNGDGTFTDVTQAAGGVRDTYSSAAAAWCDYDRDGDLDLYVANYENASYVGYPDVFWINTGEGTFVNGTLQAGLSEEDDPLPGRGVAWGDFNGDFWPDLYVSNYRLKRNYLYQNLRGVSFVEVGLLSDAAGHPKERAGGLYYGHSVGACWGDYDNDGDLDLWVTNLAHKDIYRGPLCDDSMLLENPGVEGDYLFRDVRASSGIPVKRIPGALFGGDELFVGCAFGDVNSDGYLDLYLPQIYNDVDYAYSFLYLGRGDGTFVDVTEEAGVRVWDTYGAAFCDYDLDGDLDLITGGKGASSPDAPHEVHLFRNDGPTGNYLEVELRGRDSNSYAVGARIVVEAGGLTLLREVSSGGGSHGQQNDFVQHFGLGEYLGPLKITIHWPSGRVTHTEVARVNRRITLVEPSSTVDISVEEITLSDPYPLLGDTVTFTATVRNSGDASLNYLLVTAKFLGEVAYEEVTEEFSAGEVRQFNFTFEIPSTLSFVGNQTFTLSAETLLEDLREEDNTAAVKVPIRERNAPPEASLRANPQVVRVGEPVELDATGSRDDTPSLLYLFDFGDGNTTGWISESTVNHTYTLPGNHTAEVRVRDSDGVESEPAEVTITVLPSSGEGGRPTARIVLISPNPAKVGEEVIFRGEGDPWGGYPIQGYRWRSSLDGVLSFESTFTRSDLSPGLHRIEFYVMDSRGVWSEPDVDYLTVEGPEELPWVSIMSPTEGEEVNGTCEVSGTSGPEGRINYVEISVDGGPWRMARGAPQWRYTLDTTSFENGPHTITARAYDGLRYSRSVSIMIYVDNSLPPGETAERMPPQGEGGMPLYIPAAVILVASALVVLLLRRGRG